MKLGEMTDADKVMKPQHFWSDPADVRILLNLEIQIGIPDHFCLTFRPWQRLYSLSALVVNLSVVQHQLMAT